MCYIGENIYNGAKDLAEGSCRRMVRGGWILYIHVYTLYNIYCAVWVIICGTRNNQTRNQQIWIGHGCVKLIFHTWTYSDLSENSTYLIEINCKRVIVTSAIWYMVLYVLYEFGKQYGINHVVKMCMTY